MIGVWTPYSIDVAEVQVYHGPTQVTGLVRLSLRVDPIERVVYKPPL